jgi:outer membrane receptor protein involved in Fe transport
LTLNVDLGGAWTKVKNAFSNLAIPIPAFQSFARYQTQSDEVFGTVDLDYAITPKLSADLTASYSGLDNDAGVALVRFNLSPQVTTTSDFSSRNTQLDVTAKLNGSLFSLPAGDVRFSLGGGVLDEYYKGISPISNVQSAGTLGRRSTYAFGEVYAPLISPVQNIPFVHRLSLDLAARYTDYQDTSEPRLHRDFGDSTDPKIGLLWSPVESLNLRGTWGSAFRAPSLTQLDATAGQHYLVPQSVGGTDSILLGLIDYAAADLRPETADTYTLGFDYESTAWRGFRLSATYYNINYSDRIDTAPTGGLNPFDTPGQIPDLIYRPPSAAFLEDALRTTPLLFNLSGVDLSDPHAAAAALFARSDVWVFDNRFKNLSISRQDGLDLTVSQDLKTGWGDVRLGMNATHILSYRQQGSSTSPVVSSVDVPGEPADWRGRAYGSLSVGGFSSTLSINYTSDYTNALAPPGQQKVDSWTTVDLSVTYDFRGANSPRGPRLSLSIQNLTNEDPPLLRPGLGSNIVFPVGFDPSNANPLGRFVVVGLTQAW